MNVLKDLNFIQNHWNSLCLLSFDFGTIGFRLLENLLIQVFRVFQFRNNRKPDFFSVSRFFAGPDFAVIEIGVVDYPSSPVLVPFEWILIWFTDLSSIGNGQGEKPVKITEIEKSKIRLSIKTGYKLSTVKFSDHGVQTIRFLPAAVLLDIAYII